MSKAKPPVDTAGLCTFVQHSAFFCNEQPRILVNCMHVLLLLNRGAPFNGCAHFWPLYLPML